MMQYCVLKTSLIPGASLCRPGWGLLTPDLSLPEIVGLGTKGFVLLPSPWEECFLGLSDVGSQEI